jgi:hypothetical protein
MDIIEVYSDLKNCQEGVRVLWGTHGDTLFVYYESDIAVVKLRLWANFHSKKKEDLAVQRWLDIHRKEEFVGDKVFFMTDRVGRRYFVRMIRGQDGLIIFINNLTDHYPVFMFNMTPTRVCN